MLNTTAIRLPMAPVDGNFTFNISECEATLPSGTVDHTVEPVYQKVAIVRIICFYAILKFEPLLYEITIANSKCVKLCVALNVGFFFFSLILAAKMGRNSGSC